MPGMYLHVPICTLLTDIYLGRVCIYFTFLCMYSTLRFSVVQRYLSCSFKVDDLQRPQTDYVRKALNECQLLLFLLPAGMTNKDWQGEQVCREDGGIMPYIMDHAKPLPPPSGETIARRNLR